MSYETKFAVAAIVNYEFIATILHTKLTENDFVGSFVEHFEHISGNIHCRGVLQNRSASVFTIELILFSNRTHPILQFERSKYIRIFSRRIILLV